jgi:hypothetical protein
MSELMHQQSGTEYQIRINGHQVAWFSLYTKEIMDEYANVCRDNPKDYVDIVSVRTEILLNQGSYQIMKRHFDAI